MKRTLLSEVDSGSPSVAPAPPPSPPSIIGQESTSYRHIPPPQPLHPLIECFVSLLLVLRQQPRPAARPVVAVPPFGTLSRQTLGFARPLRVGARGAPGCLHPDEPGSAWMVCHTAVYRQRRMDRLCDQTGCNKTPGESCHTAAGLHAVLRACGREDGATQIRMK